ncbi:hypothetical protein Tco_0056630, partial [Tanacetum coccineum]
MESALVYWHVEVYLSYQVIYELDPLRTSDFLPSPECDSILYESFSVVDALPSTNNEDKVFNSGILIHENLFKVTIRATPDKNVKKISISNASLILEDFNPPLYELPFHKEIFTDEHALDYSSPPLWDDCDDELFDLKIVNDNTYDDPFDSKEEKIKDSKILIDELDPPGSSDFLPFHECDLVFYEDFYEVDALPLTNNKDNVFNLGILIHENLYEVTNCETMEKNVKKTTNASLILEDFNPPLYELPFHKEVPGLGALLSFSSENEEKFYNPEILTSKRVHTSLLPELSHRGTKTFKVTKILESPMEIFPCS